MITDQENFFLLGMNSSFSFSLKIVALIETYISVRSRPSLTFRVVTQHPAGKIKDSIVQKKFDFCIKTFVLVPPRYNEDADNALK